MDTFISHLCWNLLCINAERPYWHNKVRTQMGFDDVDYD